MGNEVKPTALVRVDDHDTSIKAAKKIETKFKGMKQLVIDAHKTHPQGMTDSELRTYLNAKLRMDSPESTYRKRRTDLFKAGYIERTLDRRANPKGSPETVWRVLDEPRPPQQEKVAQRYVRVEIMEAAIKLEREACEQIAVAHHCHATAAAIRARGEG